MRSIHIMALLCLIGVGCDPDPSCAELITASPALRIGTGQRSFIPLQDEDALEAEFGPQGGQHIWISAQTVGLDIDDADGTLAVRMHYEGAVFHDESESLTRFRRARKEDDAPVMEAIGLQVIPSLSPYDENSSWLYGDFDPETATGSDWDVAYDRARQQLQDEPISLELGLTDACGVEMLSRVEVYLSSFGLY